MQILWCEGHRQQRTTPEVQIYLSHDNETVTEGGEFENMDNFQLLINHIEIVNSRGKRVPNLEFLRQLTPSNSKPANLSSIPTPNLVTFRVWVLSTFWRKNIFSSDAGIPACWPSTKIWISDYVNHPSFFAPHENMNQGVFNTHWLFNNTSAYNPGKNP